MHFITSISRTLLHVPIVYCVTLVLIYITLVHCYLLYGLYPYKHSPRLNLESELYKNVSDLIIQDKYLPQCNYSDLISSNLSDSIKTPKLINISTNNLINGSFIPEHCRPMYSVAVLVPYRNRKDQLDVFLPNIHNFLRRQKIHYKVYLIEQQDNHPWNKGILYNVGARQAILDHFPCLIFHDVDLIPLDHSNLYVCMKEPRHMSASIDDYRFVLIYDTLFGGVVSIRADQYVEVNGYSNKFDNWGGEDSEFAERILENGFRIRRYPPDMSRYAQYHGHRPRIENKNRWKIMEENRLSRRWDIDGFVSVQGHVLKVTVEGFPMYTLVGVKRLRYKTINYAAA